MITGRVTSEQEAIVKLVVISTDGEMEKIEAVIDTGFDGWLSLPGSLIRSLGLPWRQPGRAVLADGSESLFDIYKGTVIWDSMHRCILVDEADAAPLVGMSLMDGYELKMQVRVGGKVTITPLSRR